MSNAVIVICTRRESSRFPDKVFRLIAGIPAIEHLIRRILPSKIPIIIAPADPSSGFSYLSEKYGVQVLGGNAQSPLHRMERIVKNRREKWVVRITHDDILIDPKTMIGLIDKCEMTPNCGYGISPDIIEGAGVEVIHRDNLIYAAENRIEPTEYISYFVKASPHPFEVVYKPRESICRPYRLTMDYYEDYVVLETIFRSLGIDASLDAIASYLDRNPYLLRLNKQPETTIYTCAYNAAEYIEQTIQTVITQPFYKDFEYIFVDDGSTDATLEKAMRFNFDPRIRYFVNERNMGLANSSNFALNKARGQYVMRIDADDVIFHETIPRMIRKSKYANAPIVYSGFREMSADGTILSETKNPRINHHAGCSLMDKRMINEIRFTENLRHWDSYDLFMRIKDKFNVAYLDESLWLYRVHPKSLSHDNLAERKCVLDALKNGYGS